MFKESFDNLRTNSALVHNITNYVTVNDVANVLLAAGASPIMSDEPEDVRDITSICGGLVLNIGTLNERSIAGMFAAGERAAELGHAIVLDPVGAGASALRTQTAGDLLDKLPIAGAVVAVTGAIDIVADAHRAFAIRNGSALMGRITGAGCMLTCVCAAYAVANPDALLESQVAAVASMGLAGQVAQGRMGGLDGNGSFRTYLLDALYHLDGNALEAGAKVEELA